jgi:cold-inducible RNA-binding protein
MRMKNIFVGNLSYSVTEQTLRSLFETYGSVERVNVVTDRDSGQPRGFAFVEMTNDAEAEKAIGALNGKDMEGRQLNVNEARPKGERAGRSGGFGGGRGGSGGGPRRREPRW